MTFVKVISRSSLVTLRTHKKIMRDLHRELMEKHLDDTVPLHFKPGAENVYHYQRRSKKYQERKRRVKGHNRPLVWSGRTERELKQQKQGITSTATRSRLQYTLHWQKVANRKKASTLDRRGNTYQRKLELEKILNREVEAYGKWLENRYVEEINKPANQAQRRRLR